jgi:hypothetical protein
MSDIWRRRETTDERIIREQRHEIATAPICEPGPDEHIAECMFSRTGWAVVDKMDLCTCKPAAAPVMGRNTSRLLVGALRVALRVPVRGAETMNNEPRDALQVLADEYDKAAYRVTHAHTAMMLRLRAAQLRTDADRLERDDEGEKP